MLCFLLISGKGKNITTKGMNKKMNIIKHIYKKIKGIDEWFYKWEKIGIENFMEIPNDLSNTDNSIHCQYCKSLLPIIKVILKNRHAKSSKQGYFSVICPHCKRNNAIKRWGT